VPVYSLLVTFAKNTSMLVMDTVESTQAPTAPAAFLPWTPTPELSVAVVVPRTPTPPPLPSETELPWTPMVSAPVWPRTPIPKLAKPPTPVPSPEGTVPTTAVRAEACEVSPPVPSYSRCFSEDRDNRGASWSALEVDFECRFSSSGEVCGTLGRQGKRV
jgi:hypothetical protein